MWWIIHTPLLEELGDDADEIGKGEVVIGDKALDLMELSQVSGVESLVTVNAIDGEIFLGSEHLCVCVCVCVHSTNVNNNINNWLMDLFLGFHLLFFFSFFLLKRKKSPNLLLAELVEHSGRNSGCVRAQDVLVGLLYLPVVAPTDRTLSSLCCLFNVYNGKKKKKKKNPNTNQHAAVTTALQIEKRKVRQ